MLAASECEPEQVFQAMAMDPLTSAILSLDQIRQLTRQLLRAHAPYLPEAWNAKTLAAKKVFYS
jgi:alpha-galactosidase